METMELQLRKSGRSKIEFQNECPKLQKFTFKIAMQKH